VIRDAEVSPCGRYRYKLYREWDAAGDRLVFVMLNPSTADANVDDPTIRKCIGFATRMGYGQIVVLNLFAYRATKPEDLWAFVAANGDIDMPENECVLRNETRRFDVCIAWGANARRAPNHADYAKYLIRARAKSVFALRLTNDGIPCHPLMLPYSCVDTKVAL
jgi:hypothetical protein